MKSPNHREVTAAYRARQQRNEASRRWAKRNALPWTDEEDEFLREWDGTAEQLTGMAYAMERTFEALRQRSQELRRRDGKLVPHPRPAPDAEPPLCDRCYCYHHGDC